MEYLFHESLMRFKDRNSLSSCDAVVSLIGLLSSFLQDVATMLKLMSVINTVLIVVLFMSVYFIVYTNIPHKLSFTLLFCGNLLE